MSQRHQAQAVLFCVAFLALGYVPVLAGGAGQVPSAIRQAFGGSVSGAGATDGQVLAWTAASSKWEPADAGGGADLSAVAEDVVPDADSTRDLGSSSKAWAEVHADLVNITGAGAVGTPAVRVGASSTGLFNEFGNQLSVASGGSKPFKFTNAKNYGYVPIRQADDCAITFGDSDDVGLQGELTTLTNNSASTVFSVVTANGDMAGLVIDYTIQATDATEYQAESGTVRIAIVDDAGGVVASTPGESSVQALSSGTLTTTWSVVTTDDQSIEVQVTADSSLTTSTFQIRWKATYSGDVSLSVP